MKCGRLLYVYGGFKRTDAEAVIAMSRYLWGRTEELHYPSKYDRILVNNFKALIKM
jgi:hypothetical protein